MKRVFLLFTLLLFSVGFSSLVDGAVYYMPDSLGDSVSAWVGFAPPGSGTWQAGCYGTAGNPLTFQTNLLGFGGGVYSLNSSVVSRFYSGPYRITTAAPNQTYVNCGHLVRRWISPTLTSGYKARFYFDSPLRTNGTYSPQVMRVFMNNAEVTNSLSKINLGVYELPLPTGSVTIDAMAEYKSGYNAQCTMPAFLVVLILKPSAPPGIYFEDSAVQYRSSSAVSNNWSYVYKDPALDKTLSMATLKKKTWNGKGATYSFSLWDYTNMTLSGSITSSTVGTNWYTPQYSSDTITIFKDIAPNSCASAAAFDSNPKSILFIVGTDGSTRTQTLSGTSTDFVSTNEHTPYVSGSSPNGLVYKAAPGLGVSISYAPVAANELNHVVFSVVRINVQETPGMSKGLTTHGSRGTPVMGFNGWNRFGCANWDYSTMTDMVDALTTPRTQLFGKTLAQIGYDYLVLDDCWSLITRNLTGFLVPDPIKFPGDSFTQLISYAKSKGLFFGIYTDIGALTCQGRPGALGFETKDAAYFASIGVDYVKADFCSVTPNQAQDPAAAYRVFSEALRLSGRFMMLSIVNWGQKNPWEWGFADGDSWRTTPDLAAHWNIPSEFNPGWFSSISEIIERNSRLYPYSGLYGYNDADMLAVGADETYNVVIPGLPLPTQAEERTHFLLWCMMKSPLFITSPDNTTTLSLLGNNRIVALNQDPGSNQAIRIARNLGDLSSVDLWLQKLSNGDCAMALVNNHDTLTSHITVDFSNLGHVPGVSLKLLDLWGGFNSTHTGSLTWDIQPHDSYAARIFKPNNLTSACQYDVYQSTCTPSGSSPGVCRYNVSQSPQVDAWTTRSEVMFAMNHFDDHGTYNTSTSGFIAGGCNNQSSQFVNNNLALATPINYMPSLEETFFHNSSCNYHLCLQEGAHAFQGNPVIPYYNASNSNLAQDAEEFQFLGEVRAGMTWSPRARMGDVERSIQNLCCSYYLRWLYHRKCNTTAGIPSWGIDETNVVVSRAWNQTSTSVARQNIQPESETNTGNGRGPNWFMCDDNYCDGDFNELVMGHTTYYLEKKNATDNTYYPLSINIHVVPLAYGTDAMLQLLISFDSLVDTVTQNSGGRCAAISGATNPFNEPMRPYGSLLFDFGTPITTTTNYHFYFSTWTHINKVTGLNGESLNTCYKVGTSGLNTPSSCPSLVSTGLNWKGSGVPSALFPTFMDFFNPGTLDTLLFSAETPYTNTLDDYTPPIGNASFFIAFPPPGWNNIFPTFSFARGRASPRFLLRDPTCGKVTVAFSPKTNMNGVTRGFCAETPPLPYLDWDSEAIPANSIVGNICTGGSNARMLCDPISDHRQCEQGRCDLPFGVCVDGPNDGLPCDESTQCPYSLAGCYDGGYGFPYLEKHYACRELSCYDTTPAPLACDASCFTPQAVYWYAYPNDTSRSFPFP